MFLDRKEVEEKLKIELEKNHSKIRKEISKLKRELEGRDTYFRPYIEARITVLGNKLRGFNALKYSGLMVWRPRLGKFQGEKSYGGNWYGPKKNYSTVAYSLDVETGVARSYDWYILGKPLDDGAYLANSFHYSVQTFNHYVMLKKTLKILGIKNILKLEAPEGLQDLEASRKYHLSKIGNLSVEIEFGKSKGRNDYRKSAINYHRSQLEILKRLGAVQENENIDAMIEASVENSLEKRKIRLKNEESRRETAFIVEYERALAKQDLKKIVELRNKDLRRVKRGKKSFLENFKTNN